MVRLTRPGGQKAEHTKLPYRPRPSAQMASAVRAIPVLLDLVWGNWNPDAVTLRFPAIVDEAGGSWGAIIVRTAGHFGRVGHGPCGIEFLMDRGRMMLLGMSRRQPQAHQPDNADCDGSRPFVAKPFDGGGAGAALACKPVHEDHHQADEDHEGEEQLHRLHRFARAIVASE